MNPSILLQLEQNTLDEGTIEDLCNQYQIYPGCRELITAINVSFPFVKPQYKLQFIRMIFSSNRIERCEIGLIIRLISHWNNVAKESLSQGRYYAYMRNQSTIARLRILAHYLESNNLLPDSK